ncbi:hypothetical protein ACP70R_013239 [Stipagrostis hirtigluma subsp. patula]
MSSSSCWSQLPLLFLLLLPCCLSCSSSCHHQHKLSTNSSWHHHQRPPWHTYDLLLDARRGTHVAGIADLKRYLARFGYYHGDGGGQDSNAFDARLEAALELYQSTLGLPVTARLDAVTLGALMSPRCGVPDHRRRRHHKTASRFAYFTGRPRWNRQPFVLTYAISPAAVRAAFRRAFARWARVIPVRFLELKSDDDEYGAADVKVGFYVGSHGDGEPFDGQLGVLGHAFSPPSGQLHLDGAERWAVDLGADESSAAVDLESVATHEIGHVLGLAHSASPEAVMYPNLKPRSRKVELTADDVRGVQALYGSNPSFSLSSLAQPDPDTSSSSSHAPRPPPPAASCCHLLVLLLLLRLR